MGQRVLGLSMALGPIIGGALVDSVGWRGVFWVNIPVGVAAIILTALFVPESRAGTYRRPDPFGQILVMITLGTVTYGIIEGPDDRVGVSAWILACFAGWGAVALAAFLWYEPRRDEPLLDLRFFRSLAVLRRGADRGDRDVRVLAGFLFLITLYLQDVRGYRPLTAGLFLLPMALVMAFWAPLAGRVAIARRGTRIPLIISGAGIAACGLLLMFLTATSAAWYVLLCGVVFGVGQGWLNAPITNNAVAGMPRSQAGVAAGIASTGRQVGSSLGVAVMGSVLVVILHGPLAAGFVSATRPGWWIITGAGVAVLALALYTTGRAGQASPARTASLITKGDDHIPVRVLLGGNRLSGPAFPTSADPRYH